MSTPRRIQRKRTKGWRMPEGAIYVGRPTRWGNPFKIGNTYRWLPGLAWPVPSSAPESERLIDPGAAATAVSWYQEWIHALLTTSVYAPGERAELAKLAGHDLACWCPLDSPCHADVLLEIANQGAP